MNQTVIEAKKLPKRLKKNEFLKSLILQSKKVKSLL